jgi:protein lifeguard
VNRPLLLDIAGKMASTTKYTPAPQEDAEETYAQAPPSYQAAGEPSSANDQEALFGAPRGEEDNVPDDFKVCSSAATHQAGLLDD